MIKHQDPCDRRPRSRGVELLDELLLAVHLTAEIGANRL
jgi:hypothetical protein